ncbi:MAG: hypothetical protein CMF96_08405 [Candidatus Marinimicrobia bacterium]|nr:hypothetical protein [Candidatus Neomarinimicrobiota bacterium]MAJ44744.1 hypothetical protein [Candidatus Neomarinimicrobiota bacterium]|tara:strand:+ start:225 stop:659 length:435 start_codon:yes stop_codon:yes gene_type:complete
MGEKIKLFGVGKDTHIGSINNWINQNNGMVNADVSPFLTWSDWSASQRVLFVLDKDGLLRYQQNISGGINDSVYNLIEELMDEIENTVFGDINQDGVVNIVDIVQTVNMVLGTIPTDSLADVNNDGLVNIVDIVSLVNIILGNN